MFAPQPIRFQYGSNGLLAAAAASAGYGRGFQSSPSQNVVQGPSNHDLNLAFGNEFGELNPQANLLQRAGNLNSPQQPEGSSTSGNYFSMANPMTKSIAAAKSLARSNIDETNLTDDQKTNLDLLQKDQTVNPDQFSHYLGGVTQGQAQQTQRQQIAFDAKAKLDYANSAQAQMDPEDAKGFIVSASDPRYTLNDVRLAGQQLIKKHSDNQQETTQQETKKQLFQQDQQNLDPKDPDQNAILQASQAAINDPKVSTQAYLQMREQGRQHLVQKANHEKATQDHTTQVQIGATMAAIRDLQSGPDKDLLAFVNQDNLKDADPDTAKKYQKLTELRNKAEGLRQQLGQGGPKNTLTPEIVKQYIDKAGGDRAKAKQLAQNDGYQF